MMDSRRARRLLLVSALVLLAAGCASRAPRSTAPAQLVTVAKLVEWAQQGTPPTIMYGEIQRSGTVYRLTPEQRTNMIGAGVPPGLMSDLGVTYEHAIRTNPALETSDKDWHEIDGYWYGGTPFGWPSEWVVGAPPLGAPLRKLQ